ncbi:MAG: VanZ family protein [Candidatus Omnitrophota bacterium]
MFKLWAPAILWAAVISGLSSMPGRDIPQIDIPHIDKLVHFAEFLILGFLTLRAVKSPGSNISLAKAVILSIIIISLYAALDEWHQHFIPGRTTDIVDFIMDITGAIAGMMLHP